VILKCFPDPHNKINIKQKAAILKQHVRFEVMVVVVVVTMKSSGFWNVTLCGVV
jgi:hypothetical protein